MLLVTGLLAAALSQGADAPVLGLASSPNGDAEIIGAVITHGGDSWR